MEFWRDIPGFEGRYSASSEGRIKSHARVETYSRVLNNGVRGDVTRSKCEKILGASEGSNGYLTVRLMGKTRTVHSLVLLAYRGPRPPGMEGCHGDGNKLNCCMGNLRWDTSAANNAERYQHGMAPLSRRANGQFAKRNEDANSSY